MWPLQSQGGKRTVFLVSRRLSLYIKSCFESASRCLFLILCILPRRKLRHCDGNTSPRIIVIAFNFEKLQLLKVTYLLPCLFYRRSTNRPSAQCASTMQKAVKTDGQSERSYSRASPGDIRVQHELDACERINCPPLFPAKLNFSRRHIFFQVRERGCAWNRKHYWGSMQQPRQS